VWADAFWTFSAWQGMQASFAFSSPLNRYLPLLVWHVTQ
jgi:hypothetical protein